MLELLLFCMKACIEERGNPGLSLANMQEQTSSASTLSCFSPRLSAEALKQYSVKERLRSAVAGSRQLLQGSAVASSCCFCSCPYMMG